MTLAIPRIRRASLNRTVSAKPSVPYTDARWWGYDQTFDAPEHKTIFIGEPIDPPYDRDVHETRPRLLVSSRRTDMSLSDMMAFAELYQKRHPRWACFLRPNPDGGTDLMAVRRDLR